MADEVQPQSQSQIQPEFQSGFMNNLMNNTPRAIWGFAGAIFTVTLMIVILVKVAGFEVPIQRIVNAYADRIEAATTRVEDAANSFKGLTDRMDAASSELRETNKQIAEVLRRLERVEKDQSVSASEVAVVKDRVLRLEIYTGIDSKRR